MECMAGHGFSHRPQKVEKITTEFRKIQTPIPVPESLPILEEVYRNESHSMHGQMPIIWDRAEGFQVYDPWGMLISGLIARPTTTWR